MCGICGLWGRTAVEPVRRMMDRMTHRGPDAEGIYEGDTGVLGHRRLSIMDPAGGNQPILSSDGRRVIVANGEIYNFPVLREALAPAHRFRTRSDTESALHLYEDVAEEAAERLDGMYAFAIADGPDLFVARDPVGIKPLYVGRRDGGLAFASELKALAGVADEVEEFPPGTYFHSRLGRRRFGALAQRAPEPLTVADHAARLREGLERAVVKRLMSDVPVGAFLSGGLDSSIIAALARRHVEHLHTFSVGVEGSRDIEAARRVSRYLGTEHHEYVFTAAEVLEHLPEILFYLESFDQDLVRSAIPCYFTARLAAEHVKVILTGEGADELFAGYRYYAGVAEPDALHQELHRSVAALHNVNLQRVDRLTMAHSIEGRVPFLDVEMIDLAQRIPSDLKLRRDGGRTVEKWILRKAFEDLLPHDIVWRRKEQFDEGTGTVDVLAAGLERFMRREDAPNYASAHAEADLRSPEEAVFHRLLTEAYEDPAPVLQNVARWADRPDHGRQRDG
ncbi:MAG: asparagine synthase B [Phycisphaerae bacterium]